MMMTKKHATISRQHWITMQQRVANLLCFWNKIPDRATWLYKKQKQHVSNNEDDMDD